MKVDNKIVQSVLTVAKENTIWINFNDRPIDKLFIESRNRITIEL